MLGHGSPEGIMNCLNTVPFIFPSFRSSYSENLLSLLLHTILSLHGPHTRQNHLVITNHSKQLDPLRSTREVKSPSQRSKSPFRILK
jgi:hypothetical protein